MGAAWSRLADARLLILAVYLAAIAVAASQRNLRRSTLGTLILYQTIAVAAILLFFEGAKQPWYLAHLVFPFTAALALAVQSLWRSSARRLLPIGLAAFVGLQLAYPALLMVQNKYRRSYLPAIAAVRPCTGQCVEGTAELGFGLGFEHVLDDPRLGLLTGKRPDYIVLDPRYRSYIEHAREERPDLYTYFTQLLHRDYRESFDNGYYTIYTRQ